MLKGFDAARRAFGHTLHAAVPHLAGRPDSAIVLISSITGTRSFATEGAAAYCNSELDCGFEEMTTSSGTKLGRYEIRSKIGQGGMGEANRVQQTKLMRINRR